MVQPTARFWSTIIDHLVDNQLSLGMNCMYMYILILISTVDQSIANLCMGCSLEGLEKSPEMKKANVREKASLNVFLFISFE